MSALQEGDVVRLKSGSIPMTVTKVGSNPMGGGSAVVWTQWFDREQKLQTGEFNPVTLEKSRS